jgi:putative ABC transport system permease protein
MFTITLQDLRFRARQFVIAVIGAGLVFAMTLLLAGLAAGFSVEINQTVQGVGAQSWALASGSVGRMAALSPIPESDVSALEHTPGVTRAVPLIVVPQAAKIDGGPVESVNLIGYQPGQDLGGPGSPWRAVPSWRAARR